MSRLTDPRWLGGLLLSLGLPLAPAPWLADFPSPPCTNPEIVVYPPDSTVTPGIRVIEPSEDVDPAMVQSPNLDCAATPAFDDKRHDASLTSPRPRRPE